MTNQLRTVLTAGLTVILGMTLLATIYFTMLDLQWVTFLAGVLFAAAVAAASQMSRAQWVIARRTKQWLRAKEMLAKEVTRRERLAERLKISEARARFIADALPVMLLFADRLEYCRYHNRAFAQWRARNGDQIDNRLLHEVLGGAIYEDVKLRFATVLSGREERFEALWKSAQGTAMPVDVALLPFAHEIGHAAGFYILISPGAAAATVQGRHVHIGDQLVVSGAGEELIYLKSLSGQMLGSTDPRTQLVTALQQDHFVLFGQTIRPLGAVPAHPDCLEVLLRLQQEEDYMVPPGSFIPLAEHYGLMVDIDRWVVRHVLSWALARQRNDAGWSLPLFCINLCSASLADPQFPIYVKDEIARQKFPGVKINFEITEPDAIGQRAAVLNFMSTLRPVGCRFTLDGFGGAKGSFEQVNGLPFDLLKIDGNIINRLLTNRADVAMTRALTLTARKMGLQTIAESVESDATLALLREIGVDYVQGFGIGKPGPLASVC